MKPLEWTMHGTDHKNVHVFIGLARVFSFVPSNIEERVEIKALLDQRNAEVASLRTRLQECVDSLGLILAEWDSDVHSTQCFDSRIITKTRLAIQQSKSLLTGVPATANGHRESFCQIKGEPSVPSESSGRDKKTLGDVSLQPEDHTP